MRTTLGRVAALSVLGVAGAFACATAVGATAPAPESTTTTVSTTTTTVSTTTTTTVSTTTTTSPPPLVIDAPGVTPHRGTALQVTDTVPPPSTTTTTTLPPGALPVNSGEGRRVVYSKPLQRVWTVEANGTVSKTHRVSGRLTWNQPLPGTYSVFSRSSYTCNIKNPAICWHYMVRFTKGPDGDNIGFHEIPKKNGVPVQSESQLGQPLSGGCVRQSTPDAIYIWNWAPIGTKVVVLG